MKVNRLLITGSYGPQDMEFGPGDTVELMMDFKLETAAEPGGWGAPLPSVHMSQELAISYDKARKAMTVHLGPQVGRGELLTIVAELYTYRERFGPLR